jgi:hypothetical protein
MLYLVSRHALFTRTMLSMPFLGTAAWPAVVDLCRRAGKRKDADAKDKDERE